PFMFIFNTQLLLIGIDSSLHLVLVIGSAIIANLLFAAATQGWFMTRNRWWESIALLVICFSLFRPGFWMDMIYPPYERLPGTKVLEVAGTLPAEARLRIFIEGINIDGDEVHKGVLLPLGEANPDGRKRLAAEGVNVVPFGDALQVSGVRFGSRAEKLGIETGFSITAVEMESDRPAKEWIYLPALLLLGGLIVIQRSRAGKA
ncbi:MAG: DUF3394 domain-containing protein, partial [Rhodocyclaceae bacterium]|nr:DUF3394 domain-containing protein [Rhodocyclaceae bacterium]